MTSNVEVTDTVRQGAAAVHDLQLRRASPCRIGSKSSDLLALGALGCMQLERITVHGLVLGVEGHVTDSLLNNLELIRACPRK